ncbi:GvpL/GvpF family gas vesicle protein [Rhodococcus sp. NPDC003322]
MTDGVWLYGITLDGVDTSGLAGVKGVGGEQVRTVRAGGLVAVVGSVDLDEFGEAALQRNLDDLDWLARTARAHDAVVAALLHCGPTVPLRLATLYHGDEPITDLLAERSDEFAAVLRMVTDRSEWGVKAYGDRKAMAASATDEEREQRAAGTGTAYLLRRRAELAAQADVEKRAAAHASDIHDRLCRVAVHGRRQRITDPVLTGRHAWMIHNGTYLVDTARTDEFAALVAELDAEHPGVTVELTGPWPPYSFTGNDRAAP